MDHGQIVQRAFTIVTKYRALWLFGFIVALTTGGSSGGGGSPSGGSGGSSGSSAGPSAPPEIERFFSSIEFQEMLPILIGIGVAVILVLIVVGIILTVLRYVSQVALMKMVDDYEETEAQRTVREGFRLGWSRHAFQLWLVDLIFGVPIALLIIIPIAGAVLLGFAVGFTAALIPVFIGLGCILLVLIFALSIIVTVLRHFIQRQIALNDQRVFAGFRAGYEMVSGNLGAVSLMWLIMVGIGLGWGVVSFIITIILLIAVGLLGVAAFFAGVGISSLATTGDVRWIIGGVLAALVFLPLFIIPVTFIGGLFQCYISSVWTLAYRALISGESTEMVGQPADDPPAPLTSASPAPA